MADEIVIEREFKASRALVWRAWSDPDIFSIWYGPGVETIFHKFEFEVGGQLLNEMRMGENSMFGVSIVKEIVDQEKLVLHQSTSDENGNIVPNPMMPNWPSILEAEVILTDAGEGTLMKFIWRPHKATPDELEVFSHAAKGPAAQGWNKGFDVMEEEIAKLG